MNITKTKKISKILASDAGFEIAHTSNQSKLLVVLLHGYGSSGEDLISLAPYLEEGLEYAYWFAPNAIEKMPFGGYQWFSYVENNLDKMQQGITNSRNTILAMIDKKRSALGLLNRQVCLIGFSQGAMVAIDLALSAKEPFACAISFSGALIPPKDQVLVNTKTPLCLIHGQQDTVVPFEQLKISSDSLISLGCNVESYTIPYLAHSIDLKGLVIAKEFLLKNIFH